MEVVVPLNDFSSTTSSPYVSAPSSPKRLRDPFDYYYHYTSTPTSPTHIAGILAADRYADWEDESMTTKSPPKPGGGGGGDGDDFDEFAFDFSGQLEKGGHPPDLTTADELFEEGKIRPLNKNRKKTSGASAPRSPRGAEVTRERGREGGSTTSSIPSTSSRTRKGSRSLSLMRGGIVSFLQKAANSITAASTTTTSSTSTIASECLKSSNGSRKWRLKDLLLFRSASEGRATGNKSKDPLRKFTVGSSSPIISSKNEGSVDSRNSSFRSADGSVGRSMRRARVSAHEMHYTSNRAASEEMKRKTALPFNRQGLFGCLRYNPAVNSIAKGFAL